MTNEMSHTEQKQSFAQKHPKREWAIAPTTMDVTDQKPQSFVQKHMPKSKRARVVFAAATAQIVSMVAVPLLWGVTKKAIPGILNDAADHLTNVFEKNPRMLGGILNVRTWNGLFEPEERPKWLAAQGNDKLKMQAEKFVSMGLQGVYNIFSTVAVRNSLDKSLDINAGAKAVARTQFIDTTIALGALLAIPTYKAKASENWRSSLRPVIKKASNAVTFNKVSEREINEFARDSAFFAVNIGLPDALGFTAGLVSMLGELDEKAALQEQQEAEAKTKPAITRV